MGPVTPLVPFDRIVRAGGDTTLHLIHIDYVARLIGGKLVAGSDVGQALWVERKDIPGIWQELHEDTQRLLKQAGFA